MYRMRLGVYENAVIEYHLKNYHWNEIEKICDARPDCMKCMLKSTNTPLHEICNIGSAPFNLLKKVLDCWFEATITRNRFGDTPIHNKCRNSQYSSSPVAMLIEENKKAIRMLNNTGKSPLAIACVSGACFPVIKKLVMAYPEALSIRDSNGHTPLDLLWSSFAKTIPGASAISKYLKKSNVRGRGGDGHEDAVNEMSPLLGRFYEKISFCLQQSYSLSHGQDHDDDKVKVTDTNKTTNNSDDDVNPNDNEFLLECHAIILEDFKHSPHTLLAIFLSHNRAFGRQVDMNGNTPLHLHLDKSLDRGCVSALLKNCKECVGITNNQGSLPLHSALRNMNGQTGGEDIVRDIANANIDALSVRDPFTLLHPFMSAGVSGNLQMSYDFLLKSPNVILDFIR